MRVGVGHIEAMSSGLPVIATNFLEPQNSLTKAIHTLFLGPICLRLPEESIQGHFWAEPSSEHLQSLMRRIVDNPEEAREIGKYARKRC